MKQHFVVFARLSIWLSVITVPVLAPGASVLYSNFGNASTYNTSLGNPVGNAFDGNDYAEADTFVIGGDAIFSSVRLALSCFGFCTDPFFVTLNRDAGNQPGAALETLSVSASTLGTLGANNAPLLLNSAVNPTLSSGTRYWITVRADLNDSIGWNLNLVGDSAAEAISTNGGASWFSPSGNTPGAFEISGIIPEPRTAGLLFVSAGLLLGILSHRRLRH